MLKECITINRELIESLGCKQHSVNWEYEFYINDYINIYLRQNGVAVEYLGMKYFKLTQVKEFVTYIKKITYDVKR